MHLSIIWDRALWLSIYAPVATEVAATSLYAPLSTFYYTPGEYWNYFRARWAITPPKVNRVGWNLEHCEHTVGGWPWQIWGAIRAVATVWEAAEILFFLSTKWLTISPISRRTNFTTLGETFGIRRKFDFKWTLIKTLKKTEANYICVKIIPECNITNRVPDGVSR